MKTTKLILVPLIILTTCIASFSATPEDYFRSRSVLYSATTVINFITGKDLSPQIIAKKINYTEPSSTTIDNYLQMIADAYSLKIFSIEYKDNLNAIQDKIEENLQTNTIMIATYKKNGKEHCAAIIGSTMNADGRAVSYTTSDSALDDHDTISRESLTSQYWKIKISKVYWFLRK